MPRIIDRTVTVHLTEKQLASLKETYSILQQANAEKYAKEMESLAKTIHDGMRDFSAKLNQMKYFTVENKREGLRCGHEHKTHAEAEDCLNELQVFCCQHSEEEGTPCEACVGGIAKGDIMDPYWGDAKTYKEKGRIAKP